MKKGCIIFFVALLMVQLVSAELIIDDFESSVYNKGEKLSISGTILRDTAIDRGSLELKLLCGDLKFNLPALTITIKANEAESLPTTHFSVPSAAEESCYVEVSLFNSSNSLLEEKISETFNVSDELKADEEDFQINPRQVQLGKTLTLYGSITNINDKLITGSANIYFKTDNNTYYANKVDIVDGELKYSYTVTDNKPGEYYIDVLATDIDGNKKRFENVAKFNVFDEVYIFVEPIQKKVLPDSIVHLSGELNTILSEKISEGIVQIILEDEIFNAEIKDGTFDYDLKLQEKIETGKHTLMFSFIDQKTGNWGSTEKTIYIDAVPTELKLSIFQESIKPEQLMEATIFIYDQANYKVQAKVNIELIDINEKTIFLDSTESGEKLSIDIPQYSVPGTWKLKANYLSLEAKKEIIIEEVKNVELELTNKTLYVTNTGNIEYNEPISLDLNDGDFVFTKKVSVKPGETLTIDLTEEVPSGNYNIEVTGAAVAGANIFDNVIIKGKNKKSLNFIYSSLLILVIGSLAYLSIFKRIHSEKVNIRKHRDEKHARLRLKKLRVMKEKKGFKRNTFSREQNIADFKERVLKDIRETEKQIDSQKENTPYSSSSNEEEKKDDQSGGLFNMFN